LREREINQLSIDTLRAWEKRYEGYGRFETTEFACTAKRISNGYRFCGRRARGHSIGQASQLSDADLKSLAFPDIGQMSSNDNDPPIETILSAIDRFHYAAADRELRHLASLMTPRELIHTVALPLLRAVGEQWHEQRLRIAQEHMISQLLGNLLGGMTRIYAPEHAPATILMATLSDDFHAFGILAAAILAAGSGLGVIYLGPNLPAREVVYAARRSAANVVLLSLTNPQDRLFREQQLGSLRAGLAGDIELWIALNPATISLNVKGVRLLKDFQELERELQRIGGRF
jgi:MerR family transcriptional regulator, light-induced transcriptional regulator